MREEDEQQGHDGVLEDGGEAEEEPVGEETQLVRRRRVLEKEAEQRRPQRRPDQANVEKYGLIAEPLVAMVQDEPQLKVDEEEDP